MPVVRLSFPVFVSVHKGDYTVRPLLVDACEATSRSFERSMRGCASAVSKQFEGHVCGRGGLDALLWFTQDPELREDRLELSLRSATSRVIGKVQVFSFEARGVRYACLPRLDRLLLVAGRDLRMPDFAARVQDAVDQRLRDRPEDEDPLDRAALESFLIQKGDFVTTLSTSSTVKRGRYEFESLSLQEVLAGLTGPAEFHGAVELPRVAQDLNQRFPESLLRTTEPDERVDTLYRGLYGPTPASVVILGPPGAGRTTLLHEAIHRRLSAHEDSFDKAPKVWHLDPTRVIAGMRIVGQWQRRATAILDHLVTRLSERHKLRTPDALYVDNPVALTRVGRSDGSRLTLSSVLRPYLERRRLPVFLEATPEAWRRVEEADRAFADLFQILRVTPPDPARTLRIVARQRAALEMNAEVTITRGAVKRVQDLEGRFPSGRAMPGALTERLAQLASLHTRGTVDEDAVDAAFRRRSRLRPRMYDPAVPLEDAAVRGFLESRLIGQPEARESLVEVIHAIRSGLSDPGRPYASYLFVGPTGVGKTEAAKLLSEFLFEDGEGLTRFDMNEYVDAGAAARLVGDASRPSGQLAGRLRHRPFCVLLLDEIEKAHPSVHDLLLQVLDEGRLSDGAGRPIDFTRAVILLTSNVGAREARGGIGFAGGSGAAAAAYRAAVSRTFRPELINRLDRTIVFSPLGPEEIRLITGLQLRRLLCRDGFLRRSVALETPPATLDAIAARGFDPQMGARALKRALESALVTPVAAALSNLPQDKPVVLRVDVAPQTGALTPTVLPLPLAERRPPAEDVEAPTWESMVSALEAMEASLRERMDDRPIAATATPDGVVVPPEFTLLGDITELRRRLTPPEAEAYQPAVGPGDFAADVRMPKIRPAKSPGAPGTRGGFYNPGEMRFHAHIREFLRHQVEDRSDDGPSDPGEGHPISVRAMGHQLRHIDSPAPGCAVWVCKLSSDGPVATAPGFKALQLSYLRATGYTEVEHDEAAGAAATAPPAASVTAFVGAGALELLASEDGVHLIYPPDGPPQALVVRVRPWSGGPLAWTPDLGGLGEGRAQQVIRLYVLPVSSTDPGAVSDLRSGDTVSLDALKRRMVSWLLDSAGEGP